MLTQVARISDRLVRLVAPAVKAEAAAAACTNQYCCCVGCSGGLPWQDRIRYDRICNGVYQYSWYATCGSCAA